MHLPPAASHRIARSRWHLRTILLLWGTGITAALWFAKGQSWAPASLAAVLASLVVALPALLSWRQTPQGLLQWDGQRWYWTRGDDSAACQLTPVLDFQNTLLVRLQDVSGRRQWLWLEARAAAPWAWLALRRAVFGSQRLHRADDRQAPSRDGLQEGDLA